MFRRGDKMFVFRVTVVVPYYKGRGFHNDAEASAHTGS